MIIAVDGKRYREVPGSATVRGSFCRGSGTGTTYNGTSTPCSTLLVSVPHPLVPVPLSSRAPVAFWYRYHTYWYRYQHVIFAGFDQNSTLGARVRLSFDHHFEITKEKGI